MTDIETRLTEAWNAATKGRGAFVQFDFRVGSDVWEHMVAKARPAPAEGAVVPKYSSTSLILDRSLDPTDFVIVERQRP